MRLYLLFAAISCICHLKAQNCADLFFSEYIEGSSNNKCLELYNPTLNPIDLSTYQVKIYFNGNTTSGNTINLAGLIASKGTFVICDDNATATFLNLADLLASGTFYNGDDAIVLFKGPDTIDIFGKIGVDPGTNWSSGGVSTSDHTLVRKEHVFKGITQNPSSFDPSLEWSQLNVDVSDTLQEHIILPCQSIVLHKSVEKLISGGSCGVIAPTAKLLYARPGDSVCYHYTVVNNGETTFDVHDLVDDQQGTLLTAWPRLLMPGQQYSISSKSEFTGTVVNHAIWTAQLSSSSISVIAMDSARVLETEFECSSPIASFHLEPLSVCSGIPELLPEITGVSGFLTYRKIQGGPFLDIDHKTGAIIPLNSDLGQYEIINTIEGCGKLILTGVIDGDLFGGLPKALEFKVLDDIQDLSVYGVGIANNGGGSDGIEYVFPSVSRLAGSYLYLASEVDSFTSFFGFSPDFVYSGLNHNGDDAIELFCHGQTIDAFGTVDLDGSGSSWEYTDGWAYRLHNQAPNGGLFEPQYWQYSGANALDNESQNVTAPQPFPIRSFYTNFCSFCPDFILKDTLTIYQVPFEEPACLSQINIVLGPDCQRQLYPNEVILGEADVCANGFGIEIFNQHNRIIGSSLGLTEIGQSLTYRVFDRITGQSCWGLVQVKSELSFRFECSDTTIYCTDSLPAISFIESSCFPIDLSETGLRWVDYPCDSLNFAGFFIRSFILTDPYFNSQSCSQRIFVRRESLTNLTCPENVIIDCRNPLLNAFIFSDFDQEGFAHPKPFIVSNINIGLVEPPSIEGRYITEYINTCEIIALYDDVVMPSCGKTYTIKREWTIKNWCTQEATFCEQYIRIVDSSGPIIDTLKTIDTITAFVSQHSCQADIYLSPPIIRSECSPLDDISITYYLPYNVGEKNLAFHGKLFINEQKRIQLPTGTYPVYFTLTDACWNTTLDTMWIIIHDSIPPVPVCERQLVLGIDPGQCTATVKASDLDEGSYDFCCQNTHLALASMDSVRYWTSYWNSYFINCLGEVNFHRHKNEINVLVEEWLNCFVFKDEIELAGCQTDSVVLKVFEACHAWPFDSHLFNGTPHQWFMYQISDRYACWYAWNYTADKYHVLPKPDLICEYDQTLLFEWDVHYEVFAKRKECFGPDEELPAHFFGYPNFVACSFEHPSCSDLASNTLHEQWKSKLTDLDIAYLNQLKSKRLHIKNLWQECMVEIISKPSFRPQCHSAADTVIFTDGVPEFYQSSIMNDEITYLGSAHCTNQDSATVISHPPARCETSYTMPSKTPIKCSLWHELDRYDLVGTAFEKDFNKIFRSSLSTPCELSKIDSSDLGEIDECGTGRLTRQWIFTDACGQSTTCHQKIVFKSRSDFKVCFPPDQFILCNDSVFGSLTPYPSISDDEVELIGVSYEDKVISDQTGLYKSKIIRTWKIIDWCVFNPDVSIRAPEVLDDVSKTAGDERPCIFRSLKDNGDGYVEYTQVYYIQDNEPPSVYCTQDLMICADTCFVVLQKLKIGQGEDQCSSPDALDYWYSLHNVDQPAELYKGIGNYISQTLTIGEYMGSLFARDKSGQIGVCDFALSIKDCVSPVAYCLPKAVVVLDRDGEVDIWAKDINAGSYDNCTPADSLLFSFDEEGEKLFKTFNCTDVLAKQVAIDLWVHDRKGHKSLCSSQITVQAGHPDVCNNHINNVQSESVLLDQIDFIKIGTNLNENPGVIRLHQNLPNPFNGFTEIIFFVPAAGEVEFKVVSVEGQTVYSSLSECNKGWHRVQLQEFKAKGLFYYFLKQGNHSISKRMISL